MRMLARTGWWAALVLVFAAVYLRIPPPDSTTAGKPAAEKYWNSITLAAKEWRAAVERGEITALEPAPGMLVAALNAPLDLLACPLFDWGCRFLRLDHRPLVQEKPEAEVLFKLRSGDGDLKKLLLRVEALFLRGRSFRFADFSNSELYDADLVDVDLQGADLGDARLQGADLWRAQLQGANLRDAQLQGADLRGAQLQGADLRGAQLQGADLRGAQLQGADLVDARLRGADLRDARLQGADLRGARLQGADLVDARLRGADLRDARLQGADLRGAQLRGAKLWEAQLQGADLRGARLRGADLRAVALWQARFDQDSDFSLADLRGIDLQPVPAAKLAELLQWFDDIPEGQRQEAVGLVTEALTPAPPPAPRPAVRIAAGEPALVDAQPPGFADFGAGLTTDEKAYDAALAPSLADLARSDAAVAQGFAWRALSSQGDPSNSEANRRLWPDLARRLLAAEKDGAFQLDLSPDQRKTLGDLAAKAPAPPP